MLCACGFKYTPLWIQGLKRLVLWIQILTLLEDQGLWIQVLVLLCSCAKAASFSLVDFSANLNPNRVIFDSVDRL